jgi:hypothetical protein
VPSRTGRLHDAVERGDLGSIRRSLGEDRAAGHPINVMNPEVLAAAS